MTTTTSFTQDIDAAVEHFQAAVNAIRDLQEANPQVFQGWYLQASTLESLFLRRVPDAERNDAFALKDVLGGDWLHWDDSSWRCKGWHKVCLWIVHNNDWPLTDQPVRRESR